MHLLINMMFNHIIKKITIIRKENIFMIIWKVWSHISYCDAFEMHVHTQSAVEYCEGKMQHFRNRAEMRN